MNIKMLMVLFGLVLSHASSHARAHGDPTLIFDRASAYYFQGTPAEAEVLASEINRINRFQSYGSDSRIVHTVSAQDILSHKIKISGDMLNVVSGHGRIVIDPSATLRVINGSLPMFPQSYIAVVDGGLNYKFTGTIQEAEQLVQSLNNHALKNRTSTNFAVSKLMSGEQTLNGELINSMKRSGFLKLGGRAFKQLTVVGVVTGAFIGTASAAQPATVRHDLPVGGAPIKLESSNVGAPTDFGSFGSTSATRSAGVAH